MSTQVNIVRARSICFDSISFTTPGASANLIGLLCLEEIDGTGRNYGITPKAFAVIPFPAAAGRVYYETPILEKNSVFTDGLGYYPSFVRFTISWVDENNAPLVAMPEHVMRITVISEV